MKLTEKPLVLTEFGGIKLAVPGHLYRTGKSFGYQSSRNLQEYRRKLTGLYRSHILPAISRGLCTAIYTQVSDVEEEINGLLTYDRQVLKADEAEMAELSRELYRAMEEAVR